ncbi:MAG: hypothetical protein HY370_03270 [Proteobacteria bacterium]|nr:hypothetical protein [Pseudomonadota bacterium]
MTKYSAALPSDISDVTIEALVDGERLPVAFAFTADSRFPLDRKAVTENLCDILNGQAPRHKISGGKHQFFYTHMGNLLDLRFREDGKGLSEPGLVISANGSSSIGDLGKEFMERINGDIMKKLCDAVESRRERAVSPATGMRTLNPPTI